MAAAAVINTCKNVFSARLPDEATILSAKAIAFEYIKMPKYKHFTILSDSLSCLQSLQSMNIVHSYILDILYNYYYVSITNHSARKTPFYSMKSRLVRAARETSKFQK